MSEAVDFLVIGGGIAGLSVGYELAAVGKVAVTETEAAAAYHSTGRSAAVTSENYGPSLWKRLVTASREFLENPPGDLARAPLVHPRGAIYLALPQEQDQLRQQAEDLRSRGAGVGLVSTADALTLCPVIKADKFSLGLYEPDCQDIDTNELVQVYLRGLKERGSTFVTNAKVEALQRERGLWNARTSSGDYSAPIVINAAGGWVREVALMAGLPERKVVPFRRTAVTFAAPDGRDISTWPMIFDVAETFYFKPEAGLLMVSPVDVAPSAPCDAQADELEVAVAIHRIHEYTTMQVVNVSHKWGGLRTFASDHEPVIGSDPAEESFIWLAGQGGNGVMAGPAAARLAAAFAIGEDIPADIAALDITRDRVSPGRRAVQKDVVVGSIDFDDIT